MHRNSPIYDPDWIQVTYESVLNDLVTATQLHEILKSSSKFLKLEYL